MASPTRAPSGSPRANSSALLAALRTIVTGLVVGGPVDKEPPSAMDGVVRVRSVRRRPGRGVVAVYLARTPDSEAVHVTATVDEEAWANPCLPDALASLTRADWIGDWPGIVRAAPLGVRVQAFPFDDELPALATAVDVSAAGPMGGVLVDVSATIRGTRGEVPASVDVEVVRYRAGSRCVVRYRWHHAGETDGASGQGRRTVVFGKLYRGRDEARAVHALAAELWHRADGDRTAFVPRPLAYVDDLALVLFEAARGDHCEVGVAGRTALSPAWGGAGRDAAGVAGDALAWWHSQSDVGFVPAASPRRAIRRAERHLGALAAAVPEFALPVRTLGEALLSGLDATACGRPRLVHGAFRPNQLVFVGSDPTVTDLDDARVGDPALDVGTFWAHLRPPRWWRASANSRAWHETARTAFTDRYRRAMEASGAALDEVDATMHRALLFEAAALVRLAGHGSRHLSSARPKDVAAVLAEAEGCVRRFVRETKARGADRFGQVNRGGT